MDRIDISYAVFTGAELSQSSQLYQIQVHHGIIPIPTEKRHKFERQ